MKDKEYCDIIRDLMPGYIDEVLSEAGMKAVKTHLETCRECRGIYAEMEGGIGEKEERKETLALDGLKKIRKRTGRLKIVLGIVSGILTVLLVSLCLFLFVIGEPVSTSQIEISGTGYDEESDSLKIEGYINNTYNSFGRVVWEQSEEDINTVNLVVYGVYPYPGHRDNKFSVTIPGMKGKKVYLACPDYDRLELYSWKNGHYEQVDFLEDEIYSRIPELDRKKDIISYGGGIQTVDGQEGISFYVEHLIGEDVSFWRFNDQLITDGDMEPARFEIWISLKEPYRILFYDYDTGEWTENYQDVK